MRQEMRRPLVGLNSNHWNLISNPQELWVTSPLSFIQWTWATYILEICIDDFGAPLADDQVSIAFWSNFSIGMN